MAGSTLLLALLAALALVRLAAPRWGPGTHLEYSDRLWRRRRETLPTDRALLLTEQRRAFVYGSLAADIITFKAYGGHYNHCHRWTIVEELLEGSAGAPDEAFAFGYLSHLAADTIAHNHFVPYHLVRYPRVAKGLGHLFWELSADRFVPDERWAIVPELRGDASLDRLDDLVNRAVARKALSMRTNKLLFDHVLLVSHRDAWRRSMQRLLPLHRVALEEPFLEGFRGAALGRIVLALQHGGVEQLAHVDTNGHAAQALAIERRRELVAATPRGRERSDAAAQEAARFLDGMQSPPPAGAGPHWAPARRAAGGGAGAGPDAIDRAQ